MTFYKLKNKTIITNHDMELNMKYGLPVEVFCPKEFRTIAFGPIEKYTQNSIMISGKKYCRNKHAIFGMQHLTA